MPKETKSEREALEKALKESEQRFRDYLEAAADRFWETDENHNFVFVSKMSPEANRFDSATMIGKTRWEIDEVSPDAPHWHEYRKILDSQRPFKDFEYVRLQKDGSKFHIRTSGTPMFYDAGQFKGYRGVNREISNQVTNTKIAEERGNIAQQFVFRELQGESHKFITPGIEYKEYLRQVSNSRLLDLSDDEKQQWQDERMQELESESSTVEVPFRDGRWIRIRRQRLPDGSLVALHTDVTDNKKVEKLKNEFISVASHELRTPLTSIRGAIGLVRDGVTRELPGIFDSLLDISVRICERLTTLVNDILDIGKIEAGEFDLDMRSVNVLSLVQNAMELNAAFAKQFECSFYLNKSLNPVMVRGDYGRLIQVLTNLLSNAAKYSPKDGRIELAITRRNGNIRIAVKDRGPGIPLSFKDKIFNKFSQVDSSDTRSNDGSGLGLSIAKQLVELHGGWLNFKTEMG